MINGNLNHFLDTGWWNADATLFYAGHIYFFEGYFDEDNHMHVQITKWKANNIDNKTYENVYGSDGDLVDYNCIEMQGKTEEELREKVFRERIFEGKSFWEVEKELVWLD